MVSGNKKVKWIFCPICGRKTKLKVQENTVLLNFLLFCPWCKKECLINLVDFKIKLFQEIHG